MIQDYYTGEYLKYDDDLKKYIDIKMGQMLIDWARPGKFGVQEADFKLCTSEDFGSSKYLKF